MAISILKISRPCLAPPLSQQGLWSGGQDRVRPAALDNATLIFSGPASWPQGPSHGWIERLHWPHSKKSSFETFSFFLASIFLFIYLINYLFIYLFIHLSHHNHCPQIAFDSPSRQIKSQTADRIRSRLWLLKTQPQRRPSIRRSWSPLIGTSSSFKTCAVLIVKARRAQARKKNSSSACYLCASFLAPLRAPFEERLRLLWQPSPVPALIASCNLWRR